MPTKVYIGNLPDNCRPDSLKDLFSGYGVIKELDIIKNFAFVHFDRESEATQAVKDLDNTKLLGQVITVQVSKHQKSSNSRDRDRRDDRRNSSRRGSNNNNRGPPALNPLGGILGAAPGAPALGGLGILSSLSAVSTLAAAAEQQRNIEMGLRQERERERERDQPNPDVRVRREVVHTRDVPNASKLGISNGYVIYERYYVDPSHPLLKGLPLPEFNRVTDAFVAPRDGYRADDSRRDEYNGFRDRSPLQDPQDYEREREVREIREREYAREYFDRR